MINVASGLEKQYTRINNSDLKSIIKELNDSESCSKFRVKRYRDGFRVDLYFRRLSLSGSYIRLNNALAIPTGSARARKKVRAGGLQTN